MEQRENEPTLYGHGGDVYRNSVSLDFSVSVNPLGMPDQAKRAAHRGIALAGRYPDCRGEELLGEITKFHNRSLCAGKEKFCMDDFVPGNGAAELIYALCQAVKPKRALLLAPCFSEYEAAVKAAGGEVSYVELSEEKGFVLDGEDMEKILGRIPGVDIFFLCNPNNPTGSMAGEKALLSIAGCCQKNKVIFCVDECFLPFAKKEETMLPFLENYSSLFVLRAFTKVYGMAGLRLGYGASKNHALIAKIRKMLQPWNTSLPAQMAGAACLREEGFLEKTKNVIETEKTYLMRELSRIFEKVYPSCANFLLFRGQEGLAEELKKEGILIRDCANFRGLSAGYYRVAIRLHEENVKLIHTMEKICGMRGEDDLLHRKKEHRAKPIMIQGTMSNVGKSLIAAGLCRIFAKDGFRTAPFKSQNMALNSCITDEDLEMGRAQVMQAEACMIPPSVRMNPILLKPTTDMGSQVIVNGEVVGNMHAMDYFKRKKEYLPVIREAYESLAEEYDIVVIEGAGSPAEINLKQDDIVNMGMAKLADAPVLLVGDIDRGGVFAQLAGTVWLLESAERERIGGIIVNKFRGDKKILDPGLEMIRECTGKEVVGVVPYVTDLDIDDEDSLSERILQKSTEGEIDLAVIRFPQISNFTDFQALAMEKNVSVRYVTKLSELGDPDVIFLPGTKNTGKDLEWLKESGLGDRIVQKAKEEVPVFGICGGYQMLGESVEDGVSAEGCGKREGLGLLPVRTVFEKEKTRTKTEGRTGVFSGAFSGLSGKKVRGYEIHMGKSSFIKQDASSFCLLAEDGKEDGCVSGNVMGTYLHGIFDDEEFRHAFLAMLCEKKRIICKFDPLSYKEYKERQYDKLAELLRQSLDMEKIYRIMGIDRTNV